MLEWRVIQLVYIFDNIPITTTFPQVISRLRIAVENELPIEENDDEVYALILRLYTEAKEIAKPKVIYREAYVEGVEDADVDIDGFHFRSKVLAMNLKAVHRVFAYVATCGTEVDEWSHLEKDYIISVWLDMLKRIFLHDATNFLWKHIMDAYQIEKLSVCNPGSGNVQNWPIEQQTILFDLIGDVQDKIGVTLSKTSYLMSPTKSSSGLFFPSDTQFVNCALCNRDHCSGRRAEFDEELYKKAFSAI